MQLFRTFQEDAATMWNGLFLDSEERNAGRRKPSTLNVYLLALSPFLAIVAISALLGGVVTVAESIAALF